MIRTNDTHLKKSLIVLANDPSITAWGWSVINEEGEVLDIGCIKTEPMYKKLKIRKGDDTTRRISEVVKKLMFIIKEYDVNYLLSELPHGSQNANAAVMIGMVTAIVQTIADIWDIAVEWETEGSCKQAVLGKRSAVKREMIEAIDKLYEINWTGTKYKDEAIADSLAVYHTISAQSPTLRLFRK